MAGVLGLCEGRGSRWDWGPVRVRGWLWPCPVLGLEPGLWLAEGVELGLGPGPGLELGLELRFGSGSGFRLGLEIELGPRKA